MVGHGLGITNQDGTTLEAFQAHHETIVAPVGMTIQGGVFANESHE